MDISFVIPNFNGEKLLKKNLSAIFSIAKNYKEGKTEIIVADDSSKDNSVVYLQEFKKTNKTGIPFILLENKSGKNKGFSTNVNKGVAAAHGDIVILLNTDVVPRSDFLSPLLPHFRQADVFAVGCMDESVENGKVVLRGRGKGQWKKGFLMHNAANVETGTATLWASCGSGAFRKSIWEKIGGLNEVYNPFYWEDIDLSYKAQKAGFRVVFEKKSIVRHEHEVGSIKKNYSSFSVMQTAYRNQFFFTWLNATDTIIIVQHLAFLPYFLIKAIVGRDAAFLFGFIKALFMLPIVLQKRQEVQKLVKKSDREVIQSVE